MKLKPVLLFLILMIFLQINSCSKKIKIDLPAPPYRVVLFSAMNPADSITASLSIVHQLEEAFEYQYDDSPLLSQSYITLYENNQLVDTLFYDGIALKFLSSYYPEEGKTYKLVAHVPDEEPAEGSTRIPASPGAIILSARFTTNNNYTGSLLELNFQIPVQPDEPDYFLIRAYNFNPQTYKEPLNLYAPEIGEDYSRLEYFILKGEDLDNTREFALYYQVWGVDFATDTLSIEISRLTESAYKYMLTKNANYGADGFISTTDRENIYSNVQNGYGAVMSYHTQIINMTYPPN